MSNPKDYTVGWICAISTEYVAAQAFLDEKHEGPEYVSLNDKNIYTLGKVGKHNVAIAVLPEGEYGTSSAARVGSDMLHSFPNVRIGLMVGIGGGAPSKKHDIRLGDVVVSIPCNGKGGVFQYDFGKTIQDQNFLPTGFLNQPPVLLRAAVNDLKAQYEVEGHQIEETINNVLENKPRLRKKYKRPDPSSDRLYQSRITHPLNDEASCATVCGDNPSNLMLRPERTKDEDDPAVHYGLIASANQLMKDALVRDKLVAEMDVLCFEMEAAGLMNQFACLVIRGVCDYSDSHKNKEWQGYAAMTAAAYTKDLLCRISPNKIEAEKKIFDTLSGVQESVSDISRNVDKLLYVQRDQEHEAILKWLSPIDYAPQQNDYIKRRQPGTGQWLLDSAEHQKWFRTSKQTLFCPGIPGAGKTIMSSIVVNHLFNAKFENNSSVGITYIFCNYQPQQEQKPGDLFSILLKQLVQEQQAVPSDIKNLYKNHRTRQTRPLFNEIVAAFRSTVQLFSRVFIVIDALDEYYVSDKERQESLLSELFSLQKQVELSIFVTSRPISEISSWFDKCIWKEIRAHDEDILSYVNSWIPKLLRSQISKHPQVQEIVRRDILKAVDGMFLLARLHMDSLMNQPTVGDIKQAVRNLPRGIEGLDETYEQAMARIDGQPKKYRELAKKILAWITHAKRALSIMEIRHALAVRTNTVDLDNEFLPEIEILDSICAGLVTVDKNGDIIQLVHYTTQEYFRRTLSFPNAETDIAITCITYISFNVFETGFCLSDEEFEKRLQLNPLYDYAARNWGHHARVGSTEVEGLILEFLGNEAKISSSTQAMTASKDFRWSGYSQNMPRQMTGLHLAAYFGLRNAVIALVKNGYAQNAKNTFRQTPLLWAARNGHETVVQLLLEKGAELETMDMDYGRTPLLWAARNAHETVVQLLLEKGAELETKGQDYGRTLLSWAVRNGHETIVQLLLEKGVELETMDRDYGRRPLSLAALNGHEAVVKLLQKKGTKKP